MIMSVHDPIARKRSLAVPEAKDGVVSKKFKSENKEIPEDATASNFFSEKMYSAYVKSALDSLDKNDPLPINSLTSKINLPFTHKDAITLSHMNIVLNGLIANIAKLDNKSCHELISAVLDYKWLDVAGRVDPAYEKFKELYSRFISVLVSSFPKYLHEVTKKLVGEFTRIECLSSPEALNKHHEILSKIIKFIPTCINTLPQTLQKHFPHHLSSSTVELSNYVQNLMKVISYCPDLQFNIWQLIIECCIKLDVELQNELDDLDDDEIDELINGKDDDDEDEDEENDDDDDDDGEVGGESKANKSVLEDVIGDVDEDIDGDSEYLIDPITSTANIKKLSSKLDSVMNLLLINTSHSFTQEELNEGNGVPLFNTITSLFRSHILPTHFTKSIQFIIFHISQYQPELADSYLVLLIDVAFNTNEILEKRLKAMQYLSSYIARAKNLSRHQIVFIVSYLVGWLNKYMLERECEIYDQEDNSQKALSRKDKQTGGMERFKLFYAAFQALLYIFCFRHESLYKASNTASNDENTSDSEWECDLDKFFQRVILAKFNPLKFCDETVVYIFAKLATKLNVCYCYSIIEHNKRERMLQTNGKAVMPSAVANFKQKQEFLDLEGYFPFDPLVLPTCKVLISKNYVEWSEVNPSGEDADDDEDSGSHQEAMSDDDVVSSDEEITSDEED